MKIEYRKGNDWAELLIDGKQRESGHSIHPRDMLELMRELGAEVVIPEGNFCERCGDWVPDGVTCNHVD